MNKGEIILYKTNDGELSIDVKLEDETVWLSQKQMAELFQKTIPTINEHIKNIFKEGELSENSVIRNFLITALDGKRYETKFYNLDVIISVGYRVKSLRGTQFRIWATQRLKEYIVKGFTIDDKRLEEGRTSKNYYDELLERIRKIRFSERNFYAKLKDVFSLSVDYDSKNKQAKDFYSTIQNKFHYAITGYTAAEIIVKRVDNNKNDLGLTNWKGERPTRQEAEIAKNYLLETELRQLYLLVEQFLSYAELQVERKRPMHMIGWQKKLDGFLKLNDLDILIGKGKISREQMEKRVKRELKKYLNKD